MITPLDIESVNFKKTPMGYSPAEVDNFLNQIKQEYERIYRENIELKDKISILNDGIQYYKSMETTLQNTLVLAEKTADETKATAHMTADQITKEAQIKANEILQSYQKDINVLTQKIDFLKNLFEMSKIKIKQILISELDMVLNTKIDFENYMYTDKTETEKDIVDEQDSKL